MITGDFKGSADNARKAMQLNPASPAADVESTHRMRFPLGISTPHFPRGRAGPTRTRTTYMQ